jgi:hypothetical protein
MLLNVAMSMGVAGQESGWPVMLQQGCIEAFTEDG